MRLTVAGSLVLLLGALLMFFDRYIFQSEGLITIIGFFGIVIGGLIIVFFRRNN